MLTDLLYPPDTGNILCGTLNFAVLHVNFPGYPPDIKILPPPPGEVPAEPTEGASLPGVPGRCRASRGGGVVPYRNYFSFLLCNLHTFTIPQALARQLPLPGGAFLGLCEHCKLTCGASWAPPPTGFVRTLRGSTLLTVGEDSISSRPNVKLLFPFPYQIPQSFFFF